MKGPRILVIADAAGSGHRYHAGDEAMAEVALDRLKAIVGSERIVLACPHPWTARRAYGVKTVTMPLRTAKTWFLHLILNPPLTVYRWSRLLWNMALSDWVFKAGGGNIRGSRSKFPVLSWARLMGKPVMVVSQTLGPLRGSHRAVLERQLTNALWLGVRDRTFSAEQSGLPVRFAPDDAVYLRARPDPATSDRVQQHEAMIGISFACYHKLSPAVRSEWSRSLEALSERLGATAVFIPHFAPHGQGDIRSARELTAEWSCPDRAVVLDRVPPAAAILTLNGALRLVVSDRYHGVIFGLTMGVPTIALIRDEYSEAKMRGAFDQFHLEPVILSVDGAPGLIHDLTDSILVKRDIFAIAAESIRTEGFEANIAPYRLLESWVNKYKDKELRDDDHFRNHSRL